MYPPYVLHGITSGLLGLLRISLFRLLKAVPRSPFPPNRRTNSSHTTPPNPLVPHHSKPPSPPFSPLSLLRTEIKAQAQPNVPLKLSQTAQDTSPPRPTNSHRTRCGLRRVIQLITVDPSEDHRAHYIILSMKR